METTKKFDIHWTQLHCGTPCRHGISTFEAQDKAEARKLFRAKFSLYEASQVPGVKSATKYKIDSVVELIR